VLFSCSLWLQLHLHVRSVSSRLCYVQSRKEKAVHLKELGNKHFTSSRFDAAVASYTDALATCLLCHTVDRAIIYSNRAAAKTKLVSFWLALEQGGIHMLFETGLVGKYSFKNTKLQSYNLEHLISCVGNLKLCVTKLPLPAPTFITHGTAGYCGPYIYYYLN